MSFKQKFESFKQKFNVWLDKPADEHSNLETVGLIIVCLGVFICVFLLVAGGI